MKGKNSVMIGIRVSEAVNTIIKELADKKGLTVSAFIKGKVEELASKTVNTIETGSHSVNKDKVGNKVVNTIDGNGGSVNTTLKMIRHVTKGGLVFNVPEKIEQRWQS